MIILGIAVFLGGCSSSRELSRDRDLTGNSDDNSEELIASTTLTSKNHISKGNLESLSSSLTRIVTKDVSTTKEMDEVMFKVIEYLNTPYLWGGTTKRGIDCSAFVQSVMYQALGIMIPRTSYEQSRVGEPVETENLQFGDLVFFDTMNKGRVTHVGIYLSDGYFVHSGSRTGVIVASLDSDYYSRTFLFAKRVIGLDNTDF
ncbi:MAG: NlpC/P60 family protein [Ignavibacteriaceae bacterium]|nr:C40 family peptidase [Ignavibacteria bacterium]MCC6886869.1 C40 family peptidase [Ignavibacteriales bacterium]MEB2330512.1 NlpC/P60 family protein [Ignavibacteriaceae bacterium]